LNTFPYSRILLFPFTCIPASKVIETMASRKVNGRMQGENGNGNKKSYQVRFLQKESSMLDKSFVRENLDFVREIGDVVEQRIQSFLK